MDSGSTLALVRETKDHLRAQALVFATQKTPVKTSELRRKLDMLRFANTQKTQCLAKLKSQLICREESKTQWSASEHIQATLHKTQLAEVESQSLCVLSDRIKAELAKVKAKVRQLKKELSANIKFVSTSRQLQCKAQSKHLIAVQSTLHAKKQYSSKRNQNQSGLLRIQRSHNSLNTSLNRSVASLSTLLVNQHSNCVKNRELVRTILSLDLEKQQSPLISLNNQVLQYKNLFEKVHQVIKESTCVSVDNQQTIVNSAWNKHAQLEMNLETRVSNLIQNKRKLVLQFKELNRELAEIKTNAGLEPKFDVVKQKFQENTREILSLDQSIQENLQSSKAASALATESLVVSTLNTLKCLAAKLNSQNSNSDIQPSQALPQNFPAELLPYLKFSPILQTSLPPNSVQSFGTGCRTKQFKHLLKVSHSHIKTESQRIVTASLNTLQTTPGQPTRLPVPRRLSKPRQLPLVHSSLSPAASARQFDLLQLKHKARALTLRLASP